MKIPQSRPIVSFTNFSISVDCTEKRNQATKFVVALICMFAVSLFALDSQAKPVIPSATSLFLPQFVSTSAISANAEAVKGTSFSDRLATTESVSLSAGRLPSAAIENTVFDSELDAVKHAMNAFNPISIDEDREFIGAIYQLDNEHGYLYSVAPGEIGRDKVSASIPKLKNAKFVAFWHTHGADHWNRQFFSDTDTQLVKQWDMPFYLGCADGQLRVFRPGHKTLSFRQAQGEGLGRQSGFGRGELIRDVTIRVN